MVDDFFGTVLHCFLRLTVACLDVGVIVMFSRCTTFYIVNIEKVQIVIIVSW